MKKKDFIIFFIFFLSFLCYSQTSRKFVIKNTLKAEDTYRSTGKLPELVMQEGNEGAITKLKYSSDEKYIMAATNNEAKIYERETGYLVKNFKFPIAFGDFSPDARFVVYLGGTGDEVVLQEVSTQKEIFLGKKNDSFSMPLSFSHDGKYIAVPNSECFDIYDCTKFQKNSYLENSSYSFGDSIAWSEDDRYLSIIAGNNKKLHGAKNIVFDIAKNSILSEFNAKVQLYFVDIHSQKKLVLCANKSKIWIRNIDSGEILKEITPQQEDGEICSVQFSPDGNHLYCLQTSALNDHVSAWEVKNWNRVIYEEYRRNRAYSFALSKQNPGEYALGEFQEIEISVRDSQKSKKIISGATHFFQLYQDFDSDSYFALDSFGSENCLFDSERKRISNSDLFPKNIPAVMTAFTQNKFFYSDVQNQAIFSYDIQKKNTTKILEQVTPRELLVSPSGNLILFEDSAKNTVTLYDSQKKNKIPLPFLSQNFYSITSKFSPNGNFLFLGYDDCSVLYNVRSRSQILKASNNNWCDFSADEKYFAASYIDDYGIAIYDTSTWKIIKTFNDFWHFPHFSADNKYFLALALDETSGNWSIEVYSQENWKLLKKIKAEGLEYKFFVSKDGSKITALCSSGCIHTYSFETGKLLATTMADYKGNWLTYTPEGYFNGNKEGITKFVHLVDGLKVFGLEQLFDTLYRPDLVQAKLNGENISNANLQKILSEGDAPTVVFDTLPALAKNRNISLRISVQDNGGGIGYVYLSHNGKVILLSKGEKSKIGNTVVFEYNIAMASGRNFLEAYATNSAYKIESPHSEAIVTWEGKIEKRNLFVLALGVNLYKDKNINSLKFSVSDASSVIQLFNSAPKGFYNTLSTVQMIDSDVTLRKISSTFEKLAAQIKPDDIFILYLAGHGTTNNGEYYYLPSDCDAKKIVETSVSKQFLVECLSKIPAQTSLILLDTCNSGAFVSSKNLFLVEKTAFEHLAHTSGQVIITASSDVQSALEGYKNHGVFTYVLLDAISGKANYDKNDSISAAELMKYIADEVPNVTLKKWNYRQTPWMSGLNENFEIISVKK